MRPSSWARKALVSLSTTYLFSNVAMAYSYGFTQEYCSPENTGSDYEKNYNQYQSNGACANLCIDQGYSLAVVQGYYCWCSNYIPSQQVSLSSCNLPCWGWKYELCGNPSAGLYGYIAASGKPSGTAPVHKPAPSSEPAPIVVGPPVTKTVLTVSTKVKPDPTRAIKHHHTSKWTPTPVTSVEKVTVSGAIVTHYITTVASAPPSNHLPVETQADPGLSNGAIAGIVIGVLIGVALLALIPICLCWYQPRKKRRQDSDVVSSNGTPQRESSVLSRVGLLGAANKPSTLQPLPKIRTSGFGGSNTGPNSQETISPMSQRRNSQPMFIDNRLNPNTLMVQSNASKTSVSTLQDNHDYSRPVLSVRNPDVYEGT